MAFRDGKPWLVFGTMGGDGQAQTHLQFLTRVIDDGLDIQDAIDAPRWVVVADATGPSRPSRGSATTCCRSSTGRGHDGHDGRRRSTPAWVTRTRSRSPTTATRRRPILAPKARRSVCRASVGTTGSGVVPGLALLCWRPRSGASRSRSSRTRSTTSRTFEFLAIRFAIATLVLSAIWPRARPRRCSGRADAPASSPGSLLALGHAFQTLGLELTLSTNAGFITGLYVVFTPLLAAIFLRRHLPQPSSSSASCSRRSGSH